MAKKQNRFISKAAERSLVRFGPEMSALNALLDDAVAQRDTGINQARAGRVAVERSVDQAVPRLQQEWKTLGLDAPPVAGGAFGQLLAQERGAALGDLSQRRVGAAVSEATGRRQAVEEFGQTLGKIGTARRDLASQMGVYTSATAGELEDASLERGLRMRIEREGNRNATRNAEISADSARGNALISAGIDPATGNAIPNGPLDPASPRYRDKGGSGSQKKLHSPERHEEKSEYIAKVRTTASQLIADERAAVEKSGARLNKQQLRQRIVQRLSKGRQGTEMWVNSVTGERQAFAPTEKQKRDKKKAQGWAKVELPARDPITPDVFVSAALDSLLDGHLSKKTQERLQRHYSVRDLGFGEGGSFGATAGEWRRKNRGSRGTGNRRGGVGRGADTT